jgi:formylglycine-generating enzyme required for sulfatase activity
MSQCLNPECLKQNPLETTVCESCESKILLRGRYRPVRIIGEGGFGRTFQAVDEERLNTPCVIKQFLPQQSGSLALEKATYLFRQEAVRLRDLGKHPQIPDLLAFFAEEERLYLIQDFIAGDNLLKELRKKGKFSELEIKKLLDELLPILQFVHDNKVIHRDIKPENIIRNSQTGTLFLIDFGVSKEVNSSILSRIGTITGTPGYAPPEQFRGIVHPNSDLYSLAVTCIRLLTGYLQNNDGTDPLFDSMIMEWVWKKYSSVNYQLETVLDKMLEDLPMNRFESATEVLSALQTEQSSATIISPIHQTQFSTTIINPQKPIVFRDNLGDNLFLEMVAIPGGKFLMGSPEGEGYKNEKPQHQVQLPPFYIGKYPITQGQWEKIASLPKINIGLKPKPSHFQGDNLPVEKVSWLDAQEFCARLCEYTDRMYRLPTESEWEYACRANTTTPFYFGETISIDLVNHNNKYEQTTEVGIFSPNDFGLYDMHGNVWEWCEDYWHKNYTDAPSNGNAWIGDDNKRILRGGSWLQDPGNCRCAYRNYIVAGGSNYGSGLRVACSSG